MTRRILLPLAEDTTETECGSCSRRDTVRDYMGEVFSRCVEFGEVLDDQRPSECRAAEAKAARMVEIDPADVRIDCIVPATISADDEEAVTRLENALRAHGRKVVPHG